MLLWKELIKRTGFCKKSTIKKNHRHKTNCSKLKCFKSNGRETKYIEERGLHLCVCRTYAIKNSLEFINQLFTSKNTKDEDGTNFCEAKISFNDYAIANVCRDWYFQECISSKSTSTGYGKNHKIGEAIQQRTVVDCKN